MSAKCLVKMHLDYKSVLILKLFKLIKLKENLLGIL